MRLIRLAWLNALLLLAARVSAFEGRINATFALGGETQKLLYTVGTNQVRIERAETDHPYARDIFTIDSGALTLLFPHNRSFVHLKPIAQISSAAPPGFLAMPALPPDIGAQPQTPGAPALPVQIGSGELPGLPQAPQMRAGMGARIPGGMPAMAMMPMPMEKLELKPTGQKTNLLGLACEKFEIKQRGEVIEIWATDKLLPFQPYLQNQPSRFGPPVIGEQWGRLLQTKKLFPLLAVLRSEQAPLPSAAGATPSAAGPERLRYEVQSIKAGRIDDKDGALFQPPEGYQEIQPLRL